MEYRAVFVYEFKEFVQPLAAWKEETHCISVKKEVQLVIFNYIAQDGIPVPTNLLVAILK